MNNARIYNLDAAPAQVQSWWELENTKLYYRFSSSTGSCLNDGR